MEAFEFRQAKTIADATGSNAAQSAETPAAIHFIAGGTTLVDLMKLDVERPTSLVDINALPLTEVTPTADGGVRIGAMVRNSDLAHHELIRKQYAVLSQALLSGASPQLRNMATTGGNLLQRTRCYYFRDPAYAACNKRNPGSGCAALDGFNRNHAILGTSEHCIATHPSDMAVAMTALAATIQIAGPKGNRSIPINELYLLPGSTPHEEYTLAAGELITSVTLPALAEGTRSYYLKLRDRQSYEFALASAAVVVVVEDGRIHRAQIALGGVGTRPWHAEEAARLLVGKPANEHTFKLVADSALRGAKPLHDNAYKVELAKLCLARALKVATTETAQTS